MFKANRKAYLKQEPRRFLEAYLEQESWYFLEALELAEDAKKVRLGLHKRKDDGIQVFSMYVDNSPIVYQVTCFDFNLIVARLKMFRYTIQLTEDGTWLVPDALLSLIKG